MTIHFVIGTAERGLWQGEVHMPLTLTLLAAAAVVAAVCWAINQTKGQRHMNATVSQLPGLLQAILNQLVQDKKEINDKISKLTAALQDAPISDDAQRALDDLTQSAQDLHTINPEDATAPGDGAAAAPAPAAGSADPNAGAAGTSAVS